MTSVRRLLPWLIMLAAGVAAASYFGWLPRPGAGDVPPAESTAAAPPAAKEPDPIPVTVAAAVPRSVERRVRTVGTLHGFEEIDVGPLVDGGVHRIRHDVGDVVSPGDVLLEIDDADFSLAVREATRALELELARLGLTRVPEESFDPMSLPAVQRSRLVERNALETLERYRGLAGRGVMTKDEFEKAELNLETARLDTKQRLLEADQTLAAVRHRQAVLETTEKRLRDTRILAPEVKSDRKLAYTVAERLVAEGEIVRAAPPTRLFRLVVDNILKLRATVPERYASQVVPGQPVDLSVESLPGRRIEGRVVRVNPTIDTGSRTFEVEVEVPNADRLLKPGSFATASILIGSDAGAVTVPEEAIVRFAGVTKIFAVVDGRARAVPVEPGTRIDVDDASGHRRRWVAVTGPAAAGDIIVMTGHSQLTDGAAVRIRGPAGGEATSHEGGDAGEAATPAGGRDR